MEGLFNPLSILLHTVNALILFVALYFLLYKPVKKFLDKRSAGIARAITDADKSLSDAQAEYAQAQEKNNDAQTEANALLKDSAKQAKTRAEAIIADANEQAKLIIDAAKKEAETIFESAREAMADEAAALSVEIASKILAREINLDEHRQMIDEFLQKVG